MSDGRPKSARTWLITGADKGLGYETAKTALERGDNVVVTVLANDGHHRLLAKYPDRLRAFHLDARDHARIGSVVAAAEAAFGSIDVLVNNAGYGLIALAEATGAHFIRGLGGSGYPGWFKDDQMPNGDWENCAG